jgi:hypothetical protein
MQQGGAKEQKVSDLAKRSAWFCQRPRASWACGKKPALTSSCSSSWKDSSGFEKFLAANRLDRTAFEDIQRALLLPDAGWWDPSKAASLPTIQIRRPKGPTLNIGYAPKPGGTVDFISCGSRPD